MNITNLTRGLALALAAAGMASAQQPNQQPLPNILEDYSYVRRFSAGITGSVSPFPLVAAAQYGEGPTGTPPVELRSNVDPNTKVWGYGITAQVTLTERLALTVQPVLRSFNAHTFLEKFTGTDNASTSFDDRDKDETDEFISGRHIDVPVMLRLYSKGHHDEGGRWFFEGGPVMRLTRGARAVRRIFPDAGGELNETIKFPSKNGLGVTVGIGGQLIDDFGIRAIPEFRYTRWVTRSFDSIETRTRINQMEILFTLSF